MPLLARLTLSGIGRSDLIIGAGHVRLGPGIASGLDRDNAIDDVGLFPAPLRGSELVCCLGLGRELMLQDLELLLLSGEARTLIRLKPLDLLAEGGDLRS